MKNYNNMPDPIFAANAAWEAAAIEKCRNDPRIEEAGLCYVCMCPSPCLCDLDRIHSAMLAVVAIL